MDETYHEPWCDRDHTPRQRCNRALAPETMATDAPSENGASTRAPEPAPGSATAAAVEVMSAPEYADPPADDQPSPQRDVAVSTDMPAVSRYAAEEWERTEERLSADRPSPLEAPAATTPAPARERPRPPLGALLALALLAIVLWRLFRRPA